MANYIATRQKVLNHGCPPVAFLDELVAWGQKADAAIFERNENHDIYSNVFAVLGPWEGPLHRRAVMLEAMRVLAGFESSWDWKEGPHHPGTGTAWTQEAGAWQVSADSMNLGRDLKGLMQQRVGTTDPLEFQVAMKRDHELAMEYVARLLRITVNHNGPVKRHEIDPWLRRDAVREFQGLLLEQNPISA